LAQTGLVILVYPGLDLALTLLAHRTPPFAPVRTAMR
jgi:hypothetical protein